MTDLERRRAWRNLRDDLAADRSLPERDRRGRPISPPDQFLRRRDLAIATVSVTDMDPLEWSDPDEETP